jgi:hypothetical protein
MIEPNTIDQILSSTLPPSMERAADIIKKSLKFYQELKKQYLLGTPEEKTLALKAARMIFARLDVEIIQICETMQLRVDTFKKQIVAYFTPQDAAQYLEATEFINAHQQEIFAPASKAVLKPAKPKISRMFC